MSTIKTFLHQMNPFWKRSRPDPPISEGQAKVPPRGDEAYKTRIQNERAFYKDCLDVHQLPEIHNYWANSYIRPKQEVFGFSNPNEFFHVYAEERCRRNVRKQQRMVSIGSGNCDMEVELAVYLRNKNIDNFIIDCLDLNDDMLERGLALARQKNVLSHITSLKGDFNYWKPQREYDIIMASQSLHHVLNLEGLFENCHDCLKSDGFLITSDMIGRNGHLRWPEALDIVQEFWKELPQAYKYNRLLNRHEEAYENWDCSTEGFEGIRAQDILPLLVERFHFSLFISFGNVIDIFVDRCFGHNFNASAAWDKNFIDRVHERDETEMRAGNLKPTHMLAVMKKKPDGKPLLYHAPLTPEFCIRRP